MAEFDSLRQIERIDQLIQELEQCRDPSVQAKSRELVDGVLEFHRVALGRLLATLAQRGPPFQEAILGAAREDALITNLLVLHNLHPTDLRERIAEAIADVRPVLPVPNTDVEIVEVSPQLVRLTFAAPNDPATFISLQRMLENAVLFCAPDVAAVECRAAVTPHGSGFVPLPILNMMRSSHS